MLELIDFYKILNARFGFLNWWPAGSREEIIVGAILTQQASWKNVEKAIQNLKKANVISVEKLAKLNLKKLEKLVRPSGFYRQKAKRLKTFMNYVYENYQTLDNFFNKNTEELREELLKLNGVGKETADSIILYAAEKPIFVIDAYTRRIIERVYGLKMDYSELQGFIQSKIEKNTILYKDFHAQFVELGKENCKTKPLCEGCPLNVFCSFYSSKNSSKNYKR
ncbi:MAG: helix-hairpin-helix domain-containing protein [Candidatus Marsarchaeota archaeon]|nr:helix-hairpin-helix domain-containing protein [Candidatus Marsarchaeota archaeon]